jgi:glycerophosphoryl diester phosphodiesterase
MSAAYRVTRFVHTCTVLQLLRSRTGRVTLSAHRGAQGYAPENTLAAFRLAVDQGAELIELDVHQTRDRQVVVIHDDTLDRTTTGSGWVGDSTWSEVRKLDAGGWFGAAFAGEPLPRLSDVLTWARPTGIALAIELKRPNAALGRPAYPEFSQRVVRLIEEQAMTQRVLLHSDHHPSLREVKQLSPDIATAAAVGGAAYIDLLGIIHAAGANGLTIHWRWVDRELVELCHGAGLHVFGFGIHEDLSHLNELHALLANGVDLVSSSYPDRLRRAVAEWRRTQIEVPSAG